MKTTYKDAGVDIANADKFVERIKTMIGSTYTENVVAGVGGFAALYDIGDRYLAAGTDGVGTKLKLAQELNIHHTIGIDLVAMCVNDIICTGARPMFFLDYLATGKLDGTVGSQIVRGIVEGCRQAECALIGGETAEMPGMYTGGEYDLAGFAVGDVEKSKIYDGKSVEPGHYIVGFESSGFHSNGYSLIRKLIKDDEVELKQKCLTPTKIYVSLLKRLKENFSDSIKGVAHITGGGFDNIKRINPRFSYHIQDFSFLERLPDYMEEISKRSQLERYELLETFNMGIGLVVVTDNKDLVDQGIFLGVVGPS